MNKGGKTYYSLKESNELIVPDFHHYFAKQSLAVLILVVKGWAVDDLAHVRFLWSAEHVYRMLPLVFYFSSSCPST